MVNPFIFSKIAGVTFEGRQDIIRKLGPGSPLFLERQPENPYDCNAIKLLTISGEHIGYVGRVLAESLAESMDKGNKYECYVSELTGGNDKNYGLNIKIMKVD